MARQVLNPNSLAPNDKLGDTPFDYTTKLNAMTLELYSTATLDQQQMFYVSKAGNDSNSGLNINEPKLTVGAAITAALLLTPAELNQIVIEIPDSGTYSGNIDLPEWVHINAPNAAYNGRITISDNTIIKFRRLQNDSETVVIVRKLIGTGFAKVTCDLIIVDGALQEGVSVNAGLCHIDVGLLQVDAGTGIKTKNSSRVSFIVPEIILNNGAIGIGTTVTGGGANSVSGIISYASDTDNTSTLIESRVSGDVINIQAGSLSANTLYNMDAGTTLNVFANEVTGAVIEDPTATINSTVSGVSNFIPTTDIIIDRVLEAVSLATSQEPAGLGIANALQLEFGVAQFTVAEPVMIDVNGLVTFNVAGMYRVKSVFQFGRTGASGTSELLFRLLVNGVQLGRSVGVKLGNSDDLSYIDIDNWFNVPAGTTLVTEIMRDNSGNDSGGIFKTSPTDEGAGTWGDVPCTVLRIERWASPV